MNGAERCAGACWDRFVTNRGESSLYEESTLLSSGRSGRYDEEGVTIGVNEPGARPAVPGVIFVLSVHKTDKWKRVVHISQCGVIYQERMAIKSDQELLIKVTIATEVLVK